MNLASRFTLIAFAVLLYSMPGIGHAATITVDVLGDTGTAPENCELRSAILAATTNNAVDGCVAGGSSDIIEFSVEGAITLTSDLPDINREVQVNGPGMDLLAINGSGLYRPFNFVAQSGNSAVRGLSLTKGFSSSSGGCIAANGHSSLAIEGIRATKCQSDGNGGALYLIGAASISRSVLTSNVAANFGGGAFFSFENSSVEDTTFDSNEAIFGGGIYINNVSVTVKRCTFHNNEASHSGGGISVNSPNGLADITHTTISQNLADSDSNNIGNSGGIQATSASLTLTNSIVSGNSDLNSLVSYPDLGIALPVTITSGGYNFIGQNDGAAAYFPEGYPNASSDYAGTTLASLQAELLALGTYGGSVPTMPPTDSSPLIDLGNCPGEIADQRGFSNPDTGLRVNDLSPANAADGCDIGAVELPLLQEQVFDDGFEKN